MTPYDDVISSNLGWFPIKSFELKETLLWMAKINWILVELTHDSKIWHTLSPFEQKAF